MEMLGWRTVTQFLKVRDDGGMEGVECIYNTESIQVNRERDG